MFVYVCLLLLLALSLVRNIVPQIEIGVKEVSASPASPTLLYRWKFENSLVDTGSYSTKYNLAGHQVAYTSLSAHSNLGYALGLNGSMYAYNNTFLDDINTRFSSTGFTVSVWINTTKPAPGFVYYIYKKLTNNDFVGLQIYQQIYFAVEIGGTTVSLASKYSAQGNVWHNIIVMMASNGTMYLYVNNVLMGTSTTHNSIPPNADANKDSFYIGYDPTSDRYYANPIDEIQVFTGLLTESQRNEILWEGVEPVAGQDWTLRGNALLRDKIVNHDRGVVFLNTEDDGFFHEKYIFKNMTLTLNGSIGCGASTHESEINMLNTTIYFNKTGTYFGGEDKWRWINYTNVKALSVSGTTFKGVSLGYAMNLAYVKGLEVRGASYRGIDLVGASAPNLHVENVYIYNGSGDGLYLSGAVDNGYFKNITILNMAGNQTVILEGGADNNRFYDLNITDSIGAIPPSGNFVNIINSNNNYFKNSIMNGWSGATDKPHKAFYFSGTSNNNTVEDATIWYCGNGIYSSVPAPYINYVKNITVRHFSGNNADAIDGDMNATLVIENSFLYDAVHGLSVEGGVVYRVYNTVIQCGTFDQQTTYRGDIYPVYGTVYLTNSPIQSVAHKDSEVQGVNIYQQWNSTTTNVNVTLLTKYFLNASAQNINVTLQSATYESGKLTFTVSAPSGTTSTTKVYVDDKGKPKDVNGASNWFYENGSQVLTITVLHRSSETVEVFWSGWTPPNVPWSDPTYIIIGLTAVVLLILFFLRRRLADLYKTLK